MNSLPSLEAGQRLTARIRTASAIVSPLNLQGQADHRAVEPDQKSIHGVALLGDDAAPDEQHHQRRHQQHREEGRGAHGEGLGVGKRLEEASFLRLEGEDRQEGDRDDEQAEEESGSDLDGGLDQHLVARLVWRRLLKPLMGILDHDDGGVHHGADGDGDAAEAHDVGAQAEQPHADIGDQHAERQRDDGDERASRVQQENDADERDDGALLQKRPLERIDSTIDQVGAVVDGFDAHALGKARCHLREPVLHVLNDGQGVLAVALQRDARDDFTFAVHLGDAAALIRGRARHGPHPSAKPARRRRS